MSAIQKITALLCRGCCSMRGSNPRLLAHKTNTLPTELMEPTLAQTGPRGALSLRLGSCSRSQASPPERAVLAEWLRRMLKAHVRKSVGSIPTDCTPFLRQRWGCSSLGRAVGSQSAGTGIETLLLHLFSTRPSPRSPPNTPKQQRKKRSDTDEIRTRAGRAQ